MMKTKRKSKWEKKLTLTEIKHLRENTDGTLRGAKETFQFQKKRREDWRKKHGTNIEPCWDCKFIAQKLGEPV